MQQKSVLSNLPDLDTERLRLRWLRLDDADAMFAYASSEEVTRYTSWPPHRTREDSLTFLKETLPAYENPLAEIWTWGIALKETDLLIGTFALFGRVAHHDAEIGYAVGREYWGRGYVPEAALAVLDLGFTQLGLNRIQAMCFTPNIASARVMEKVGMTYEGVLREYLYYKETFHDAKVYSILKREYDARKNRGSAA